MYVRNDKLFPPLYSIIFGRLAQRSCDTGVVFVGEDKKIRFLDDKLERVFMPVEQPNGKPIDYYSLFFELNLNHPKDLARAQRTPLHATLDAAKREDRSYVTSQSLPVILTPNGLAHQVETTVQKISGIKKYLVMELWVKRDPKFWTYALDVKHEPNILRI